MVEKGTTALLDCGATGNPTPDIYWVKDARRLAPNPRFSVVQGGKNRGEWGVVYNGELSVLSVLLRHPQKCVWSAKAHATRDVLGRGGLRAVQSVQLHGAPPWKGRQNQTMTMVPMDFWRNSDLFEKKEHFSSSKTDKVRTFLDKSLKFSIENLSKAKDKSLRLYKSYNDCL